LIKSLTPGPQEPEAAAFAAFSYTYQTVSAQTVGTYQLPSVVSVAYPTPTILGKSAFEFSLTGCKAYAAVPDIAPR